MNLSAGPNKVKSKGRKGSKIIAVNVSDKKGMRKSNIGKGILVEGLGLENDAHAAKWHRQVSLLDMRSIQKMVDKGLNVGPGDFAENLTTEGIELLSLPVGTKLSIGKTVLLEVSQIGKVCRSRCAIFYQAGDCVMPREGIFAKVLKGGKVKVGDNIGVKNV